MALEKSGKYGSLYIFLAASMWSTGGLLVKFIPWGALTIACFRCILTAVVILVYTRDIHIQLTKNNLFCGVFCFFTSVGFIMANKMTTAANAIVLHYTMPMFVILFSAIWFKTRPNKLEILTVILTFSGVLLFFADHLGSGALKGDLLAVGTGMTYAMFVIINNQPRTNTLHASVIGCTLTLALLPFVVRDPALSAEPKAVIAMLVLGVFQNGISYVVYSKGIKAVSAVTASILSMIEPVLSPIWVYLAFSERPGSLAVTGSLIVLSTVAFYNIWNIRRYQRKS